MRDTYKGDDLPQLSIRAVATGTQCVCSGLPSGMYGVLCPLHGSRCNSSLVERRQGGGNVIKLKVLEKRSVMSCESIPEVVVLCYEGHARMAPWDVAPGRRETEPLRSACVNAYTSISRVRVRVPTQHSPAMRTDPMRCGSELQSKLYKG